jgi:outer membrane protein assembly factor BamB
MIEGDRITILDNTDGQDASGFAPYIDLPMPFENLQWTQFNGSSRRTMTHVAVNPDVKEVWKKKIGAPSDGALGHLGAPPVIVGEYVYTMDARSKISAYNSLTGATYWEYVNDSDGDKGGFGGGLAASGTHLFVTLGLGEVLCLDTETGILLWKKELSAPVRAAPALYGDVVIVVSRDDKAFGLDAETGAIKWSFQGVRGELSSIGAAVPAADRGIAVIPFSSGEIVAVRVSTGERIWTRVIDSGSATSLLSVFTEIAGGPVIYSDRVIASSYSGALVSLDLIDNSVHPFFRFCELGKLCAPNCFPILYTQ